FLPSPSYVQPPWAGSNRCLSILNLQPKVFGSNTHSRLETNHVCTFQRHKLTLRNSWEWPYVAREVWVCIHPSYWLPASLLQRSRQRRAHLFWFSGFAA